MQLDTINSMLGFSNLLSAVMKSVHLGGVEPVKKVLQQTLSLVEEQQEWIAFWSHAIVGRAATEDSFGVLMDFLVREVWLNQWTFEPLLHSVVRANFAKKDVMRLHSSGHVWASAASVMGLQPAYPTDLQSSMPSQADANFNRVLKESRFWILKDLAISTKDSVLALIFWEQFFLLYFEACGKNIALSK
jgi:hypothetical protein